MNVLMKKIYFTIHEIKMKEPGVKVVKPEPAGWLWSLPLDLFEKNPLD